jgi:hypothetical protein
VRKNLKYCSILRKQGTALGREGRKDEGLGRVKEVTEKRVKANIRQLLDGEREERTAFEF